MLSGKSRSHFYDYFYQRRASELGVRKDAVAYFFTAKMKKTETLKRSNVSQQNWGYIRNG